MRKKVSLALIGMAAAILLPVAAMAARSQTDVSGVVTLNGNPVKGAKVAVHCGSHTKKVTTDNTGTYLAVFKAADCPAGSTVTVNASKKHKGSGSNTGTANAQTTRLNVALVNVAIPELGLFTGIGALIVAGGVFLVTRRRHLAQT